MNSSPLWRRGAFGQSGRIVLAHLAGTSATVAALEAATELSQPTISRALRKLHTYGLVVREKRTWALTALAIADVAQHADFHAQRRAAANQRQRHAMQRATFVAHDLDRVLQPTLKADLVAIAEDGAKYDRRTGEVLDDAPRLAAPYHRHRTMVRGAPERLRTGAARGDA